MKNLKWLNNSKKIKDHSSLIFLSSSTNTQYVTGYFPYIFELNPSLIPYSNIYQIKYVINNQEIDNFKFFPTTLSSDNLLFNDYPPDLTYPLNPGDPRNYNFTYHFNNSSNSNESYTVSALVYRKGFESPICNIINLSLSSQQTLINSVSDGFFDDMALAKHYMFGPNNDIIYFLQSKSPDYLLPVLINWNN
jgi:hypothetical protein